MKLQNLTLPVLGLLSGLFISFIANGSNSYTQHESPEKKSQQNPTNKNQSDDRFSVEKMKELKEQLSLLEGKAFMPTILPVIMKNKEALQLTKEQEEHFVHWRKDHLKNVLSTMTSIIEKHIQFKKMSLNPDITSEELLGLQSEIFELQKSVLKLKLECREHLVHSFSQEQWDDFSFILSEHPALASFLN